MDDFIDHFEEFHVTCVACGTVHESYDKKLIHEKYCKNAREIKINWRKKRDAFQKKFESKEDSDSEPEDDDFNAEDFSDAESDLKNIEINQDGNKIKLPGKVNENGT